MLDILRYFLGLIIDVFNQLFAVKINLYDDVYISLGVALIAVAGIGLLLGLLVNYLNLHNFTRDKGDDE